MGIGKQRILFHRRIALTSNEISNGKKKDYWGVDGKKIMEAPGFEPGAFRMQSECDTTTPRPQGVLTHRCNSPIVNYTHNFPPISILSKAIIQSRSTNEYFGSSCKT